MRTSSRLSTVPGTSSRCDACASPLIASRRALCLALTALCAACDGRVLDPFMTQQPPAQQPPGQPPVMQPPVMEPPITQPPGTPFVPPSPAAFQQPGALGETGAQRLSRRQLLAAAENIFGVPAGAAAPLAPFDSASATYFESDYRALAFTSQLILDYESFATEYARAVRADRTNFVQRAGCTPTGSADTACFVKYAQGVGRRVLRRTVSATEAQAWAAKLMPYAVADSDFYSAVEGLVAMWLQHPEFLYRVEKAGAALDGFEIATRMSFFITGLPPDDALLDAASRLTDAQARRAEAERLLSTPAAIAAAEHFHARWLGFDDALLPNALDADARNETAKLVGRIAADGAADWLELFNAKQTWVTPALATHYGLPAPGGSAGWVTYPSGRAAGVLGHATVARLGAKFGDTSPTLRGYELMKRALCGKLSGQIPPGVDIDTQPGLPTDCKSTRYYQRGVAACATCHAITDNIGFGLENLGPAGEWRTEEPQNAACAIDGKGEVGGQAFTGPEALGEVLRNSPAVAACATKQLFHVLTGRLSTTADAASLEALAGQYWQSRSWRALLLAVVTSPAMAHKGAN
ncbi:MAG: DUF1592 domain-containing protein [Myxococcaceae bacterium]|nr:DUF1592 domain-containing protein [Myxococcaceae bacterium]